MMYKLTTKDGVIYTIPKENLALFAYTKAQDVGVVLDPTDIDVAKIFLKSIGIEVSENE